MTAAAAEYGDMVLAGVALTEPGSREEPGRRLLQELCGRRDDLGQEIPVAVAGLIANPADAAVVDAFNSYVITLCAEQAATDAAITELVTGFCRRQAAAGDVRAMTDLGEVLRWQEDFVGAHAAYQQAIDAGSERALIDLGRLLCELPDSVDSGLEYLRAGGRLTGS